MTADLQAWVGRERRRVEALCPGDLARMAAVLDRAEVPETLPPAWHWGAFHETPRQSEIGEDGHPRRGGFLPPVEAPRRMFAAAAMRFGAPLRPGVETEIVETIASVAEKPGRSGPLTFVEVERRFAQDGAMCVEERQTLVYRQPDPPGAPATAPSPYAGQAAEWRRELRPDPALLFRFSAATFNAHRIHYDRPYATGEEGYPGLVVHGPLIALSLLEALAEAHPGRRVASFSFRAQRPLFDGAPFHACGRLEGEGAKLWAEGPDGVAMTAEVGWE